MSFPGVGVMECVTEVAPELYICSSGGKFLRSLQRRSTWNHFWEHQMMLNELFSIELWFSSAFHNAGTSPSCHYLSSLNTIQHVASITLHIHEALGKFNKLFHWKWKRIWKAEAIFIVMLLHLRVLRKCQFSFQLRDCFHNTIGNRRLNANDPCKKFS
jgi:hypothetical protein